MEKEPYQLPEGTLLQGQYVIKNVLGQGGFGITYMGWDMHLDTPVAIKEYFPKGIALRDSAVSEDIRCRTDQEISYYQKNKRRFMQEAKTLAQFSDVYEIVQVKNFFQANNTAYIVMEYVDGITLAQYVRERGGKISLKDTLEILQPVMKALCALHEKGVIHRDISPDNIMILPDGRTKLLDFGSVRTVDHIQIDQPLTKSTEMLVKQGYAPIEQYQNRGNLGPWTDVYAVCATIYYCITGQAPTDAPGRLLGEEEIRFRNKEVEISEEKEKVLKHGLELRSKDRLLTMEQLCRELCEEDSESTDDSKLTTIDGSHGESKKRKISQITKKRGLLFAGLLVLCLIGAIGILGKGNAGNREPDSSKRQESNETIVSGQCGDQVTWELNRDIGTLTLSGTGKTWWYRVDGEGDKDEGVYASVENLKECGITEQWFQEEPEWFLYEDEIKKLVIEDGITELSAALFRDQYHLESVEFGSVRRIWWGCFSGCSSLKEAKLPDTLMVLGNATFRGCDRLETVEIPDGSAGVEGNVFVGCPNLKEVLFGKEAILDDSDLRKDEINMDIYSKDVVYYGYIGSSAEENARKYGIAFQRIE